MGNGQQQTLFVALGPPARGGVPEKRKWKNCSLKKDPAAATMIDNHLRLGNF